MNKCKLCEHYGTPDCSDCVNGQKFKELSHGCDTCRHCEREDYEHPCSQCKHAAVPGTEEYNNREDFWRSVHDEEYDAVTHPEHYTHGKFECIDVMLDNFGKEAVEHFCLLNAFKYVWRSHYKNGIQDIKKAMWYLDKYLELEGEKYDG